MKLLSGTSVVLDRDADVSQLLLDERGRRSCRTPTAEGIVSVKPSG